MPGDLNRDCTVDMRDALLLAAGVVDPSSLDTEATAAADVASTTSGPGVTDGDVNGADLVVLLRALVGLETIAGGTWEPIISSPNNAGDNPIIVQTPDNQSEFQVCPGAEVSIYVNDLLRATTTADASGEFLVGAISIDDLSPSANDVYAVAELGGYTSGESNHLSPSYTNNIDRTEPPNPVSTVVWVPGGSTSGPYTPDGDLTIANGTRLIVAPGTEIEMDAGSEIIVQGVLLIQGVGPNDTVLISGNGTAWDGVRFSPASTAAVIDIAGAVIDDADIGVDLQGSSSFPANALISDSEIRVSNSGIGINIFNDHNTIQVGGNWIHRIGTPGSSVGIKLESDGYAKLTAIDSNLIEDLHTGIQINRSSPDITGNEIADNSTDGILIERYNNFPTINQGNYIHGNTNGIMLKALVGDNPWWNVRPVINENHILSNSVNLKLSTTAAEDDGLVIDATENNWGFADPVDVQATIVDDFGTNGSYNETRPLVDFTPFLHPTTFDPIQSYVQGNVDANSFASAPTTVSVIGPIVNPVGKTAVIPAGVTIQMPQDAVFHVREKLLVQGTLSNPVTIQSDESTPAAGDWPGIEFLSGSGSAFDFAVIEHATTAIEANGVDLDIVDSTFNYFSEAGVQLTGATSATVIDASIFDNYPGTGYFDTDGNETGTGVELFDSSPIITGNEFQDLEVGIHIADASNPVIDSGNIITENMWGIWVQGPGIQETTVANPNPTVNGNDIFQNDGDPIVPPSMNLQQQTGDISDEAKAYLAGPAPRCNNQPANVCVSDLRSNSLADLDFTGNWWGSGDLETIQSEFTFHPQSVPELDIDDYLDDTIGNGGMPVAQGQNAWATTIFGVSHDVPRFSPRESESVTITFYTAVAGDATIKIYEEDTTNPTPVLVRTIEKSVSAGGPHTESWDGKRDSGFFVPDEAYAYEIELEDAQDNLLGSYKPAVNPLHYGWGCQPGQSADPGPGPCKTVDDSYNVFRNDFWKHTFELIPNGTALNLSNDDVNVYPHLSFASRVSLEVTSPPGSPDPQSGPTFVAHNRVPVLPGWTGTSEENAHIFMFDGRDDQGDLLLEETGYFFFTLPAPMRRNSVVVDGTTPAVRGSTVAGTQLSGQETDWIPISLEVKANPFLVQHSYEQVTHIAYQLNTNANVTIKIYDPEGVEVDTLIENQMRAAEDGGGNPNIWVEDWNGLGSGSADEINDFLSDEDGPYTFEIRAEDTADPNLYSVYKGVIQVRQEVGPE